MFSALILVPSKKRAATPNSATDHGYSHSDIGRVVGKSRSHVANTLRLLNLPQHSRDLLASGAISAGHARALLSAADPDALADRIVSRGLTVRDIERLGANAGKDISNAPKELPPNRPRHTSAREEGRSCPWRAGNLIRHDGKAGEIRIRFSNFAQLDDFCSRLAATPSDR